MTGFSTNDFATLLDEVIAAGDPPYEVLRPSIVLDLLNPVFAAAPIHPADAADYLFAETVHRIEPDRRKPVAPPPVQQPRSVDPAEIARELALTGKESAPALDRARRAFAFANHPDRVDERDRHCAIVRMQIANRLIDDAKAKQA